MEDRLYIPRTTRRRLRLVFVLMALCFALGLADMWRQQIHGDEALASEIINAMAMGR